MKKSLIIIILVILLINSVSAFCPYDDAGNVVSKKLLGKIGKNMPGAGELVSNLPQLTPNKLRANLISTKINPNIVASSIVEGDLIHGTSTKKFESILRSGRLEPSATGTLGSGVYVAEVVRDPKSALEYSFVYAKRAASQDGGEPIIIRIKGYKTIHNPGYENIIDLRGTGKSAVPIENLEIWDPVIKQWVPATKYKI